MLLTKKTTYLFLSFLIFLASCQAFKKAETPNLQPIPQSFAKSNATDTTTTDTTTIASISWKDFFKDEFLEKLIDTALANNQDKQIALQRIEQASAQYAMSRAALLPALELRLSGGLDRFGDYTMNGVGNFDTNLSGNIKENQRIPVPITPDYFAGFRTSWEVDVWGKLKNKRKADLARFMATKEGIRLIQTMLVSQVAYTYYELLAMDANLEIIRKNIKLQEQAVEIINIQKNAGQATALAVQQFNAQLLRTRAMEAQMLQHIIELENIMRNLLGKFDFEIKRSQSFIDRKPPISTKVGVPIQLLRNRPDIRQAEWEILATKADLKAAQMAFLPSVNITAYAAYNAFATDLWFAPVSLAYGLLGGLTTPLFQQHTVKGNYKIATSRQKEAYLNYQKTIIRAYTEVNTQLQALENLEKVFDFKQQEVTELRNAVTTSRDLFVAGYATYLEVITAQKNALEAELEMHQIVKQKLQNAVHLYRATGGGAE